MLIKEAINIADNLSPNHFTLSEKLLWCNEVSSSIRRDAKKIYKTIETVITESGEIIMPEDIEFSDVEVAYLNGIPMEKTDLRSLPYLNCGRVLSKYGFSAQTPKILRLVYLTKPKAVQDILIKGNFKLTENRLYGENLPVYMGDIVEYVTLSKFEDTPDFSGGSTAYVQENNGQYVEFTQNIFSPSENVCLAFHRVMDDETEIQEPYDRMYIEYILAKSALYQHDYDTYSAHMIQYNNLYDEMKRDLKTRNPLSDTVQFHNYI